MNKKNDYILVANIQHVKTSLEQIMVYKLQQDVDNLDSFQLGNIQDRGLIDVVNTVAHLILKNVDTTRLIHDYSCYSYIV